MKIKKVMLSITYASRYCHGRGRDVNSSCYNDNVPVVSVDEARICFSLSVFLSVILLVKSVVVVVDIGDARRRYPKVVVDV